MYKTPFIITVDTEGDDLWSKPRQITSRNAGFLPRFQSLCERYGFAPVYLTNHEMAMSPQFVEFGRDLAGRGTGEIGMHLHAWNSPPLEALTSDDFRHQPYLIEYPARVMKAKIEAMTHLLEDRFEQPIVSHRAGRWAFDGRYAGLLVEAGYLVDCSVTPGVDWSGNPGIPGGTGGSDYSAFPERPYFFNPADISLPAPGGTLLEVPMTIRPSDLYRKAPWTYGIPLLRRAANGLWPAQSWLCPVQPSLRSGPQRHLDAMVRLARVARTEQREHVQLMLHSSELMPGGNPNFGDDRSIELLYESLEVLFENLSPWCQGVTLREYHAQCLRKFRPAGAAQRDDRLMAMPQ